jgi:hypothetical protein
VTPDTTRSFVRSHAVMRDLAILQPLGQVWPGYAQEIGRLLRGTGSPILPHVYAMTVRHTPERPRIAQDKHGAVS